MVVVAITHQKKTSALFPKLYSARGGTGKGSFRRRGGRCHSRKKGRGERLSTLLSFSDQAKTLFQRCCVYSRKDLLYKHTHTHSLTATSYTPSSHLLHSPPSSSPALAAAAATARTVQTKQPYNRRYQCCCRCT